MGELTARRVQDLGEAAFNRFRDLIQAEVGINLRESKRILVSNRLRRRLLALNLDSYDDYYELLTTSDQGRQEMSHFIDAISTNETYFYRGENQFEALQHTILPELLKTRRKLTIWSAACSTGEEAYSIVIVAKEACRQLRWTGSVEVIATDVNLSVLDAARRGTYSPASVRHLPPQYLQKYFDQRPDGGYAVKEVLKESVTFKAHNLLKDDPPKPFIDIIFCRNALMYFARETQQAVINRCFRPALVRDGFLFIGSSESFVGLDVGFSYSQIQGCQIYSPVARGDAAR